MTRFAVLVLAGLACAPPAIAEGGSLDPMFSQLPFESWMKGAGSVAFRSAVDVLPVVLSNHQRLLAQVNVQLDGGELAKRRGRGELVILFQITDRAGLLYQDHGIIDLTKVEAGVKSQNIVYTESAFALPGEYRIAIAVYDSSAKDHFVKRETLRVPVMKGDPLPDLWRDLPSIEFMPHDDTPDSWYVPEVRGRLHLPVENRRPVRVNVLVNLTPSERATGSHRVQDRNLRVLLPTLKALSQMQLRGGSMNITSLDLTRQKESFRQEHVRELDWTKMRASFMADSPGTIDVKSLSGREHSAGFFVEEVRKRLRDSDVLIVLSSSVTFEAGVDLSPIQIESTPDCRVFYIRYNPLQFSYLARRPMPPARGELIRGVPMPIPDQLEPTLKALNPRLFEIRNPEQMRKALGTLISEIGAF